jgi:thiosulfate/3-mercaptopyruvate sulfurtransferase
MKSIKSIVGMMLILLLILISAGCGQNYAETGTVIISGKDAVKLIGTSGTVLVDAQKATSYAKEHAAGAVNISRADIVVKKQVSNMLAPADVIETVMSSRGISNDTLVIIYDDNNNMDAARLWWTLLVYGHTNAKVISGGLQELTRQDVEITTAAVTAKSAVFKAAPANRSLIAELADVVAQVDNPDDNTVLIDTRSLDEFNSGTIPGSVFLNYEGNNYNDGTIRSIQNLKLRYKDENIMPDNTVIMYCKSSIRGAQTLLALYNAGYRDLKLYDGAWLEWSLDTNRPVQMPETVKIQSNFQDNS